MSYNTLQHDLDLLDHLFLRWDARESIGTEIAHAIGVGSEYRFVRELMAAYRACGRRPIETAPKDGTDILAASGPQGAWVQCAWDEDDGWVTFNRCWERETHPKLAGREFSPTIWIPLPAQPAISAVPPSQGTPGTETITRVHLPSAVASQPDTYVDVRLPAQPHPDVSGLVEALRSALLILGPMVASPFWKEAIDPVRDQVEAAETTVRQALAAFQSRQEEGA